MTPIVTGADIFRAKRILTAAEIRSLSTAGVLIAPGIPGKTMQVLAAFSKFRFGTTVWNPNSSATAILFYGDSNAGPVAFAAGGDLVGLIIDGSAEDLNYNGVGEIATSSPIPTAQTDGIGIYLFAVNGAFDSGAALAATVDPANKGLLYALTDTGTISVAGDTTDPEYTVTGIGAGGLVTAVTVAGGTGIVVAGPFATTPTSGIGDGTLRLNITAITPLGDGTLELDVLYQPI